MEFKFFYRYSNEGFPLNSPDLNGKREESIPGGRTVEDSLMEENLVNLEIRRNLLQNRTNH